MLDTVASDVSSDTRFTTRFEIGITVTATTPVITPSPSVAVSGTVTINGGSAPTSKGVLSPVCPLPSSARNHIFVACS